MPTCKRNLVVHLPSLTRRATKSGASFGTIWLPGRLEWVVLTDIQRQSDRYDTAASAKRSTGTVNWQLTR
jgi:hypothetical protein